MRGPSTRLVITLASAMASSALWWSAPEASAQGPQGFRPQTPDELPSTGRVGGSAGRNEAPGTSRNASRSPRGGSSRDTYVRVSRAPNMFGDTLPPQVSYVPFKEGSQTGDGISAFTAPLGGGGSFNVSENNTALPTDRAYFVYNGFFSAASNTTGFGPTGPIQQSVDLHRYLIGLEKTFLDGNVSLDVRMPFFNGIDFQGFGLASENGNIGNLTMYMKGLLYSDDASAWATGLGIGLPTGSDVSTSTTFLSNNETMTVRNESVTLMPFVASTITPNDRWFIQSFGQILFAASGDTVINAGQFAGVYNQQNLLQADMGVGRWLWKDATRPYFSGLAGVMELHYTSTIQNTDVVEMPPGSILGGEVSNSANRVDILNLTSGIHTQLGPMSALRVGAVVPLKQAPDRVFDSEIQVSFNRKF